MSLVPVRKGLVGTLVLFPGPIVAAVAAAAGAEADTAVEVVAGY